MNWRLGECACEQKRGERGNADLHGRYSRVSKTNNVWSRRFAPRDSASVNPRLSFGVETAGELLILTSRGLALERLQLGTLVQQTGEIAILGPCNLGSVIQIGANRDTRNQRRGQCCRQKKRSKPSFNQLDQFGIYRSVHFRLFWAHGYAGSD